MTCAGLTDKKSINMMPIREFNHSHITAIFFDIDDTFSTHGKITEEAYSALWRLKNAGKTVVPITGRPAGWCDHIARMWPVDAVVGENGAFYFMMRNGKMAKEYTADASQRAVYKGKLEQIMDEVLREVPGAAIASDQTCREFDLAVDFCEDVKPLPKGAVDKIVAIFEKYGANTKISSIHVNGWFGGYDKLTTTKIFIRRELKLDPEKDNERFVFCGDSPNDEPMFGFFKNSVGVANISRFNDRLKVFPRYITSKESGAGFAELAGMLA